jgi:hypothetical protein
MTVQDGSFYIAMAFDADDRPVGRVGQGHGIRMHDTLGKAKSQRKRWRNGTKYYGNSGRLHNHYPNAKVFQLTYVAGVLMSKEIDCDG